MTSDTVTGYTVRSHSEFYIALGVTIEECRIAANLSRGQLLHRMQIRGSKRTGTNTIYYWETGSCRIAVEDLQIFAWAVNVPVAYLLRSASKILEKAVAREKERAQR